MKRKTDSFLDHLEYYFTAYLPTVKGLAKNTIVSYKATFRLFFEYMYSVRNILAENVSFSGINADVVIAFLDWLETDRGCSVATRNQRLSALAAFSIYAQNRDFESAVVFRNNIKKVPVKKAPREGRTTFTREEVKVLFELPDAHTKIGLRDKNLLCFMYASGTRAQEVCNLTVGDVQFYPDRAGINIHGKGQKVRRIGIPQNAAEMLRKYMLSRKILNTPQAHVFSSQTHEMMSVSCIEEIYAKYVEMARHKHPGMFLKKYSPHSMRHTTATHMLEAGVPLIIVKNFLGHVSLQTTQIYTEVTQDTMNQQLKAWNDKWFLKDSSGEDHEHKSNIPSFLK